MKSNKLVQNQGAAEIVMADRRQLGLMDLWVKWTNCGATQIGPTPGPPPPCGIANVLCKFRWQTSAPLAGFVNQLCIHWHHPYKPVHRYRELIGDFFDSTFKTPW
jgi:hypothetical protein